MQTLEEFLVDTFDPSKWGKHRKSLTSANTGLNLINEINALNPNLVIDAGCGHNVFKGHIQNLIGFDIVEYPFVDIVSPIENINFRKESADVVLALGSIQFGDKQKILDNTSKILSWVKPGGYVVMRVMKEQFHFGVYGEELLNYRYFWSEEDIVEITKLHNIEIFKEPVIEDDLDRKGNLRGRRLVWWWKKPGKLKYYSIDPKTSEIKE